MIRKIDHLVITTADMNQCIAFYEKLGFHAKQTNGRYELFAGDFKINVHFLGKELSPHAAHVQIGSTDLCFEIGGDIDCFKRELEAQGIVLETDILEKNGVRGKMKSIYLRDADGNLLEFCSYE
ncbi:VOC family protein [Bacillus sp. REN10]|uniref:VOC family protein n=1 Tax=Bacillus sp. REN10 TaxID=2782541 RepID=UPI00193B45F1|nr:VOC family protein [Bacillus sp. REN10]